MHICKLCNFSCKYHSDFNRHVKTKKHLDKLKSGAFCDGCGKELSNNFSKKRHEKSCDMYQTINNIENQTNNNTTIQNQQNIENQTNIIVNGMNNAETFVISIEDLIKKNLTTALQKVILEDMLESDIEVMDLIDKFDELLEEAREIEIYDHNHYCDITKKVVKVNDDGEEEIVEEEWTPLTHPEYDWKCRHVRNDFKISTNKLSNLLVKTFLERDSNPVITHINRLGDDYTGGNLLYKHLKTLHSDQILLDFLNRSSKKHYFYIDDNYKPSLEIKKRYPQYYEKLECKALQMKENYNNVARRARRYNRK